MTTDTRRKPYAVERGLPQFALDESKVLEGLKVYENASGSGGITPIGGLWDTDADRIHETVSEATDFGAITIAAKWEIVIYPTDLAERDAILITVWSRDGLCRSQVVASTIGIKELVSREEWEATESARTIAALKNIVATACGAASQLAAAEAGERLVARHYAETRDSHGRWAVIEPSTAEDSNNNDIDKWERRTWFDSAKEAADHCDRLIFERLTSKLDENLNSDYPIDMGVEEFPPAIQRLEAFRRGEANSWCLFQGGPSPRLEFIE